MTHRLSLPLVLALLSACGRIGYDAVQTPATPELPNSDPLGPDGLGSGRSGALVINTADTLLNRYIPLAQDVVSNASVVRVSASFSLAAEDLVLLWKTAGIGGQSSLASDLTGLDVGQWELHRIERVEDDWVHFRTPTRSSYPSKGSQLVYIPEFTTLEVQANASIKAAPWDGRSGGILAFVVRETFTNQGLASATGAGFRGGTSEGALNQSGCNALDGLAPAHAPRGEGFNSDDFGPTAAGRRNNYQGGGGGVCNSSGGGGGSHIGSGGRGGASSDAGRVVGGLEGIPLRYDLDERLRLGGGGGSGQSAQSVDQDSRGLPGGGVLWFRSRVLVGMGTFEADGQSRGNTSSGDSGGGGGGAGGAIDARALDLLECALMQAKGSNGSSPTSTNRRGGGGGGGGGRIRQVSTNANCPTSVEGGAAGFGTGYSAVAGAAGIVER